MITTRDRVAVVRALVGCAEPSTAKELAARAHRRVPTSDTGLAWLGIVDWVRRGDCWRHSGPVRGRRQAALEQTAGEHPGIATFPADIRTDHAPDAIVVAALDNEPPPSG